MATKQKVVKLPEKPSALIRLALADLEKAEKSRVYEVDMNVWHRPNGVCRVCLAGSVLAFSLGVSPQKSVHVPDGRDIDAGTQSKLMALNEFRSGYIRCGFESLKQDKPDLLPNYAKVSPYADGPNIFKRDMRKLATLLAKHGC